MTEKQLIDPILLQKATRVTVVYQMAGKVTITKVIKSRKAPEE